jgi:hypothetical protein
LGKNRVRNGKVRRKGKEKKARRESPGARNAVADETGAKTTSSDLI